MNDLAFISALKDQPLRFLPKPDPLDEAFRALSGYGPSLQNSYIHHGPMAVEALDAMGLTGDITRFVQRHIARGQSLPAGRETKALQAEDWPLALGQPGRYADWVIRLDQERKDIGWKALAQRWTARLTPGAASAALHGLIRTGHAVRALERRDSPARQGELVRALASWAALYSDPAWPTTRGLGTLTPDIAFAAITPAPEDQRAPVGSITAGLSHALNAPDFADEVARVNMSGDMGLHINVMLHRLADAFLTEARSPYTAIVWCHAITATLSVRRLLCVLSETEARALLTRVFEAACAMKAAFAGLHTDHDPGMDAVDSTHRLARRAAASGDDHAIKLTDALLDAHAVDPDPVFLKAADRAIRMLGEERHA